MRFILGVLIGILVVVFIFQNTEVVDITFLFWTLSASRAIMVFVVFIVGIILGYILKGAGAKLKAGGKTKK
jgi:uncharacterized integral membrane protein